MANNNRFGQLLSEGISSVATRRQKTMAAVETDIAAAAHNSRSVVQKWRQGKHIPQGDPLTLEAVARYCLQYGRLDRQWAESLLVQGRHPFREHLLADLFREKAGHYQPLSPSATATGVELERPEGTIHPDSPFYIVRDGDISAKKTIDKTGAQIVTIKGPRQVGKSSMLVQLIDQAQKTGKIIVDLDFQLWDKPALQDADKFFYQFCWWLSDKLEEQLGLSNQMDQQNWQVPLSNPQRCERYISRYILKNLGKPLVLAMDEVDVLFTTEFGNDFFTMLRAWYNQSTTDPVWQKLQMILVTATEPYLFIQGHYNSPFNVGLSIEVNDFDRNQIAELNQRHGEPFQADGLERLIQLVAGHPYLVRKAMYDIAAKEYTVETFFQKAPLDSGPFGRHLHCYFSKLHHEWADLKPHLQTIIRALQDSETKPVLDNQTFFRLKGTGLIKRENDDQGREVFRCNLYQQYFQVRLDDQT